MTIRKWEAYFTYLVYRTGINFAFALVFTINMVYLVQELRLDAFEMVLVGTVLEISAFIFEVPTGVIADVYSRRLSVIIGLMLLGIDMLIFGLTHSFALILFTQFIGGIGYTFLSGADSAWITDEIGEERAGRAFLRGSQIGRLGGILGIILSVLLASAFSLSVAIVIGASMLFVLAMTLILFMPENGFTPEPPAERETWRSMRETFGEGVRTVRARPILLTILGMSFVFGAFTEGYDRLNTLHILENFSLPAIGQLGEIAWFGIMGIVSMIIGIVFTEYVLRKVDTKHYISIVRALIVIDTGLIAMVVLFALTRSFALLLIAFWMIDVLRGLHYPLASAWINQGLPSKVRATIISMSSQSDAIGQVAGGPGIGFIGRSFGVRTALTLGGVILAPILLLYMRTLRQGKMIPATDATR